LLYFFYTQNIEHWTIVIIIPSEQLDPKSLKRRDSKHIFIQETPARIRTEQTYSNMTSSWWPKTWKISFRYNIIRFLFGSVNGGSMNRYYGTSKSSTIWFPVKSAPSQIGLKMKVKSAAKNKNKKRINK
jgi:hypothetical protein